MSQLIIFLIGVVVGAIALWLLIGRGASNQRERGLRERNRRLKEEKEKRKKKILDLLAEKGEVANDDVQGLLGVSDSAATDYLQELEDEGKIKQVGKEGRFVKYRLT